MADLIGKILESSFTQTIDGKPVATNFEDVIDPSTGAAFQKSPAATPAQIELAIAAARRAQPVWAALSWDERANLLNRLADAMEAHRDWLSTLQVMEQGMSLKDSVFSINNAARSVRVIAAVRLSGEVLADTATNRVALRWSPLGVVAAIGPWNSPIGLGMQKVAVALIGGNTVVLKPSEFTPLGTLEIGRIAREILPPGVFNVIGGGRAVGHAMVSHSGFDKVSFTGSTATGISIAKQSSDYLRPMTLELGGNDAAILLADGSIADLADAVARVGLANRGQFCAGVKRVYAPTALYHQVCEALTTAANAIKIGAGFEPDVQMGPIQNKAQFDKICAYVEEAKAAGGRILTGGAPLPRNGYFYPPTVVADLSDGARLVDEEQFGPVVPVIAYDDLDEVITQVNRGPYGLTGSIWTADLKHGAALGARLTVGTAWINQHGALDISLPFPLIKSSGMGVDFADYGVKGAMRMQIINAKKPIEICHGKSGADLIGYK